jgi:dTDP-4-dehydrorhamnose 3,5-epimerase
MGNLTKISPTLTPLRVIGHPKGNVRHALKSSESTFHGFGEAYLTTILPGQTKGWKKHSKMHLNLVVVQGEVAFHVHSEQTSTTETFIIGPDNYSRLHVPPGLWMAFSCTTELPGLVLNLASIEHDPNEAVNVDLCSYPLNTGD